jgi:uracil-DNA glycosylase family 4
VIDTLAELSAQVSVCRACPRLVAWRERVATAQRRAAFAEQPYWGRPVPGFGDERPRVLIVGLAPAAHGGNRTGRIFTGDRSGDWLYAALHRAGYASVPHSEHPLDGQWLTGVRITAPVHCAPPDNRPTPTERDSCAPWLDRELQLVSSTVHAILALGAFGWDSALGAARRLGWETPRPKPRFGHGRRATLTNAGRPVELVGCFHVSQQNTFTGKLTAAMLDEVIGSLG